MAEQSLSPSRLLSYVIPFTAFIAAIGAIGFAGSMILENYRDHAAGPTQVPPTIRPFLSEESSFDLRNLAVASDDVIFGGARKDSIPSLTDPATVTAAEGSYLAPDDRVIGVAIGGQTRAYPLRLLNWHEIVNDTLAGEKVAVVYCPLCDSAAVFDRGVDNTVQEFGVSGLLYKSNLLMFSRKGETETLWSQMMSQRVSGERPGTSLSSRPVELTTWRSWRTRHPGTDVLSEDTGHDRDYAIHPYAEYFTNDRLMFPSHPSSNRMPAKTPVLGAWVDGVARAYPITAFDKSASVTEKINGQRITVAYDAKSKSLRVDQADDSVRWMYAFWFAWYAFNPETDIYEL